MARIAMAVSCHRHPGNGDASLSAGTLYARWRCDAARFPIPTVEHAMAAKDKDKDLNDLFLDTLKDVYFAEKQILKALPKMAKAANSDKLRAAFEKHHGETEVHIERLDEIFDLLGKAARGKRCDAIQGILDEGKEIMEEYADTPALDAGLLSAAQAVEHYD